MINQKRIRPIRVTVLTALIFCFAIWNGLRLSEAVYFWRTLQEYGTHPLYIAISGGTWLIAGLTLMWGLWQGKTWAWLVTILAAISYDSWFWIDRLFLQKPHSNWPFSLVTTAILLSFVLIILFSHKTRRFFQRDDYERKLKNTTPA